MSRNSLHLTQFLHFHFIFIVSPPPSQGHSSSIVSISTIRRTRSPTFLILAAASPPQRVPSETQPPSLLHNSTRVGDRGREWPVRHRRTCYPAFNSSLQRLSGGMQLRPARSQVAPIRTKHCRTPIDAKSPASTSVTVAVAVSSRSYGIASMYQSSERRD